MKLLTRYLAREIYSSIALVFFALLMLFAFFDLLSELDDLGRGDYHVGKVLLYVLLTVPSRLYELFPVAILIGTIFSLAQMAASSQLTIYRCSGVSLKQMILALFKISLPILVLSYLSGEFLAPTTERLAQTVRLEALSAEIKLREFRSGIWAKDEHNFVNVKNVLPDTTLLNISIYEFDKDYNLQSIISAKRASFVQEGLWQLSEATQTRFSPQGVVVNTLPGMEWRSALNLDILRVLLVGPNQMSAWNLYLYIQHLRDNQQKTVRYEIAMWNKLLYPFAVLVMILLALPFAAYRQREGGISTKIFSGIVLGLTFHFASQLFTNLGAINEWPAILSAIAMPTLFLMLATYMLYKTERR